MTVARPVRSVVTVWPSSMVTVTPEASFPSAPKTASVAECPAITRGGSTMVTVHVAYGLDGACPARTGAADGTPTRVAKTIVHNHRLQVLFMLFRRHRSIVQPNHKRSQLIVCAQLVGQLLRCRL